MKTSLFFITAVSLELAAGQYYNVGDQPRRLRAQTGDLNVERWLDGHGDMSMSMPKAKAEKSSGDMK